MDASWLTDASRAGVYHLRADAREFAQAAEAAGMSVYRFDIGHAHGKNDFLAGVAKAMHFPAHFGGNWDALADSLKDLSWTNDSKRGWVLILDKSKHFCTGHSPEFKVAMEIMEDAAQSWRKDGKAFWTLIGGPDGWQSGWPDMPET